MNAVHAREALQVGKRKDESLFDEPMNDQPVVFRVDLRDAAMVALEKQSPLGVMMPSSSCSGVKLTEDFGVAVSHDTSRRTTCAVERHG